MTKPRAFKGQASPRERFFLLGMNPKLNKKNKN
jgi:hypothetical protein